MNKSFDDIGKQKYDLRDLLPDNLAEVEKQIEYWMSRQNEGYPESNHERWVATKLEQLRWQQQKLLRSSAVLENPESPLIFLSCGQYTEAEKNLGRQVKEVLEQSGTPEVYFADYQNTLDALTNNILAALNRCVGFIGVMHHRGRVATVDREIVRASVWIEQEIAVAAFIKQVLGREIEVQLYIQQGIAREGMRDKLLLNAYTFKEDREVLEHIRQHSSRWTPLAATTARAGRAFQETFQDRLASAKQNLWLRTPRRDGVEGQVRSRTHFWMHLFPMKPAPVNLDVNISREFIRVISENFPTDRQLATDQGTPIDWEVTLDTAREFSLPISTHKEERRWRLTSGGEIGFVTQSAWPVHGQPHAFWSVYDIALDGLSLLRLASSFWPAHGYKGSVRLWAELNIGQAKLFTKGSTFPALFHQQPLAPENHVALDPGVIIGSGVARAYASAQVDFVLGSRHSPLHDTTADVLHQLVCGLGYEVDLPKLRTSLRAVFT